MVISALYLAAGLSNRMGVRKQSLELAKSKPIASMGLHALLGSRLNSVMVVVHPEDPLEWLPEDGVGAAKAAASQVKSVYIEACSDTSQGMSHSIRHGLRSLMSHETIVDAIVVTLADQPFITPAMVDELIAYWLAQPELDFVATAVRDARDGKFVLMPPVVMSSSMFEALLQLEGDAGARKLFSNPNYKGYGLLAANEKAMLDIDTPDDFEIAKRQYLGSNTEC
jgi:molybdenum cofactor cytidylyltransferase